MKKPSTEPKQPTEGATLPFALGLGLCILLLSSSIPGQTDGLGVLTDNLINDLDISRTALTSTLAIGTILFALSVPLTGQLMDRFGLHRVLFAAPIVLALILSLLTQLPRLAGDATQFNPTLRMTFLAGLFLLIRLTAIGCMGVGARVAMGTWFNQRRGLATGIFSAVTTLAFSVCPPLLNKCVETCGWRQTYLYIALYLAVIPPLCVALYCRRKVPTKAISPNTIENKLPETRPIVARLLRCPTFWVFTLGIALQAMFLDAVKIHMTDLGSIQGQTRADTYQTFYPMAVVALITNLVGGWASDRLRLAHLVTAMMGGQIAATVGLLTFDSLGGQILFASGNGLGIGLFGILNVITWPRLFGKDGLGRIVGISMSIIALATALGPVLFSIVKSYTGSYRVLLCAWPALSIIAALVIWKTPEPQP